MASEHKAAGAVLNAQQTLVENDATDLFLPPPHHIGIVPIRVETNPLGGLVEKFPLGLFCGRIRIP